MLERRQPDRSIKSKLIGVNLISTISALVLVLIIMMGFEFFSVRNDLQYNLKTQASIISENSSPAMAFSDENAANEVLGSLQSSPNVTRAVLLLPDNTMFASYQSKTASPPFKYDEKHGSEPQFTLQNLTIYQNVMLGNRVIGKLYVEVSLDRFYDSMKLFLGVILIAIFNALILSIILLTRLNHVIITPLSNLSSLMTRVSETKNYAIRTVIDSYDEIGDLARGFNNMLHQMERHEASLETELKQRKLAEDHLNELAYHDSITQLPNRHYFKERLESSLANVSRYGGSCGLIFIDLDDFKFVNDTLGHHVGDDLLKEVARRFELALRTGDIVCRIGGDEFAVIVENMQEVQQLEAIARKINEMHANPIRLGVKDIFIGASIGISVYPDHASDMATLLKNADAAMYQAKGLGKNGYYVYEPEMEGKTRKRFMLENGLRRALELNEFELYYQPQIDTKTQLTIGFEALLRWNHPELGVVNPVEFIHIAEEAGLIVKIGEWVLRTASMQAVFWQLKYIPELTMSVNLSLCQLRQDDIVDRILMIVKETKIPPHLLDIELTESTLMENVDASIEKLHRLRGAGLAISMDDFGTGYSSISYLKRFPVGTLKIDRSFISDLPSDEDDVAITKAIITMSNNLHLNVVAEGVENKVQFDFLNKHGCQKVQGFLFGRPMQVADVEAHLAAQCRDLDRKLIASI